MGNRYFNCLGVMALAAVAAAAVAVAQTTEAPPTSHMTIANPASLSGARAESVYQAIRTRIRDNYRVSGDPVVSVYQSWRRYNSVPYRSSNHGERFVNNYANDLAAGYGRFEKLGKMPPGAMVVKDSFTVTKDGGVMSGPFFLMEKKAPGFNADSGDWLFMAIRPDGGLLGMTKGLRSENVAFCAECHSKAPDGQDHLFLLPVAVRRP